MFECPENIPTFDSDPFEHLVLGHGFSENWLNAFRAGGDPDFDFAVWMRERENEDHLDHEIATHFARAGEEFHLGNILPCGHFHVERQPA